MPRVQGSHPHADPSPLGDDELVAVLEGLPDPVVVIDAAGAIVWGNRSAEAWSGWRLEELRGHSMVDLVHPDDALTALQSLETVQAKPVGTAIELRLSDRHGQYSRFEARGRAVEGVGVVVVLRDQTDRRGWEVAAGDASLLQAVIDAAPAITMLLDGSGLLRGASRALTSILGVHMGGAIGRHVSSFAVPADQGAVASELAAAVAAPGSRTFEAAFPSSVTGGPVPMSLTVVNLLDDRSVRGLVVTAVDVSLLVEARDRLAHVAGHDSLTGLPNRSLLFDRLRHALDRGGRLGTSVGVVYCDVDGFKDINDHYGHGVGDRVLVVVADRLREVVRRSDTIARIGGDEFVVVTEDDTAPLSELVVRIRTAMREPIEVAEGASVVVTVSAGSAAAPEDASPDELLVRADVAMYRDKRSRRLR